MKRLSLALLLLSALIPGGGTKPTDPPAIRTPDAASVSALRVPVPLPGLPRASRGMPRRALLPVRVPLSWPSGRDGDREQRTPNWSALAQCESGNNPHAVSPDGLYRGLFQFDLSTWRSVGGHGDPARASRSEQLLRAAALYARRGRHPWPICGRLL